MVSGRKPVQEERATGCLTVKPVGELDAGNRHVRFDERGWETERRRMAQATAPILDSTKSGRIADIGGCLKMPEADIVYIVPT
jgi:hypothetical protein